jgi:hypothetical protein
VNVVELSGVIKIGRWAGNVARMEGMTGACRVLVERHEEKRPRGRPRCRWDDNIKMYLHDVAWATLSG